MKVKLKRNIQYYYKEGKTYIKRWEKELAFSGGEKIYNIIESIFSLTLDEVDINQIVNAYDPDEQKMVTFLIEKLVQQNVLSVIDSSIKIPIDMTYELKCYIEKNSNNFAQAVGNFNTLKIYLYIKDEYKKTIIEKLNVLGLNEKIIFVEKIEDLLLVNSKENIVRVFATDEISYQELVTKISDACDRNNVILSGFSQGKAYCIYCKREIENFRNFIPIMQNYREDTKINSYKIQIQLLCTLLAMMIVDNFIINADFYNSIIIHNNLSVEKILIPTEKYANFKRGRTENQKIQLEDEKFVIGIDERKDQMGYLIKYFGTDGLAQFSVQTVCIKLHIPGEIREYVYSVSGENYIQAAYNTFVKGIENYLEKIDEATCNNKEKKYIYVCEKERKKYYLEALLKCYFYINQNSKCMQLINLAVPSNDDTINRMVNILDRRYEKKIFILQKICNRLGVTYVQIVDQNFNILGFAYGINTKETVCKLLYSILGKVQQTYLIENECNNYKKMECQEFLQYVRCDNLNIDNTITIEELISLLNQEIVDANYTLKEYVWGLEEKFSDLGLYAGKFILEKCK